ncbi:class I SAM-dependent methyltransferase [Paraliobacillus sediminis]|uniref:class I SAM-dependent methyltransferase n=1 Tax=Paraliobacillus sediminis TaxID=1885916 RepID=UPI000E3E5517|nr:class I SAM-dependent methyltransferase [Paraliobacillus sediminis]
MNNTKGNGGLTNLIHRILNPKGAKNKLTNKRFNPEHADKLMSEERKVQLPQSKIIDYLKLTPTDKVADLGAGNGYFTIPIARNTTNTVYAVDIEPKMLDMLKENTTKERLDNIDYVISDLEDIQLPDNAVNKVLVSLVIHEVTNLETSINEIKRIIKPGGELLLIEWKAIETESGPPLDERISSNGMIKFLNTAGFSAEAIDLNAVHYAIKAELNEGEMEY